MKRIKFTYEYGTYYSLDAGVLVNKDGELIDYSGEYVRADFADRVLAILREFAAWSAKYPSIRELAKELDAISAKAAAVVVDAEG